MMSYRTRGAIWDLNVKDNFKKPPDVLLFIRFAHFAPVDLSHHT